MGAQYDAATMGGAFGEDMTVDAMEEVLGTLVAEEEKGFSSPVVRRFSRAKRTD